MEEYDLLLDLDKRPSGGDETLIISLNHGGNDGWSVRCCLRSLPLPVIREWRVMTGETDSSEGGQRADWYIITLML